MPVPKPGDDLWPLLHCVGGRPLPDHCGGRGSLPSTDTLGHVNAIIQPPIPQTVLAGEGTLSYSAPALPHDTGRDTGIQRLAHLLESELRFSGKVDLFRNANAAAARGIVCPRCRQMESPCDRKTGLLDDY